MVLNSLVIGLVVSILTFFLTGFVRKFAYRYQILSLPRKRDIHASATPRLGGVAFALSIVLTLIVVYWLWPDLLRYTDQVRFGIDREFLGITIGIILIIIVGIWDDIQDLSAGKQLFWQFVAASIIVGSGIGIDFIRSPWGILPLDQWTLKFFNLGGYTYTITLWSDLFTIVWLIMIMNVVNWLDGLDGLATGVSGIASLMLFFLALMIGDRTGVMILAIALFGGLLGFLPWNWHPAKIFMGSVGSNLIGFILGILAIISGGKLATSILVLGLPVFDALWVVIRRVFHKKSPFKSDRSHLHHRLLDSGLSVPQTVLILYFFTFLFGVLALVDANARAKLVLILWVIAVLVMLGVFSLLLEKRNGRK